MSITMSLLGWILGLAAYDVLRDAEKKSEAARREVDALHSANDLNAQRISRLEAELRELKRGWRGN